MKTPGTLPTVSYTTSANPETRPAGNPVTGGPRILVGTLACGEAEFDECCRAIFSQRHVRVEHEVIRDLPELEAHRRLFSMWNERRANFELFVKIDADTVLCRDTVLWEIWQLFAADETVTAVQIGLHDYFTDTAIAGLNCFSPDVSFTVPEDPLYCDRMAEQGHRRILKPSDTLALYPAGWHCSRPTPWQAFHFGYRRMLKGQAQIIEALMTAWRAKEGDGRFWAMAGVRKAFFHPVSDSSYDSPRFASLFEATRLAVERGKLTPAGVVRDVERMLIRDPRIRLRRLTTRAWSKGTALIG